jgi:subtilase-type serine protease
MPPYPLKRQSTILALRAIGLTGAYALSLLSASPAMAQLTTWNGSQSSQWQDALNWTPNTLPTLSSFLYINSVTPNAPVIDNVSAQAGTVFLGAVGGPSLTVQNGGQLTSDSAIIGNSNNGLVPGMELESGTATITGIGSKWTATSFSVGFIGTGTMTVSSGAQAISSQTAMLGGHLGADGTLNISGAGTNWQSGQITVGADGNGTLTISDQATAQSASLLVGANTGSTGTALLTGASTTLQTTQDVSVGAGGIGTLEIRDGATVTAGTRTSIGIRNGGVGTVLISGAGE